MIGMKKLGGKISKFIKTFAVFSISGIIALSLTGCYFFPKEEDVLAPPLVEPQQIKYTTMDVKKGKIEKKLVVDAFFISTKLEALSFTDRGGTLKAFNVKLGDKVSPGQLIAELDTDNLAEQIRQQEISVKMAQLDYDKAKANPESNSFDLEKAKLNIESNQIKLNDLKTEYGKARLYSSVSGEIVYMDSVTPGGYINANKTLVTIADPAQLLLQYKGDKYNLFKMGDKVTVTYNDKEYPGVIVLCPSALKEDADKNLKDAVRVKVSGLPSDTNIGDAAQATLILEKKENVIVLPKNVVTSYNNRNFVQIMKDGMKSERDVQIGTQTDTEVEIVKGLQEGDKVIVQR